jgi:hypothetical protein
MTILAEKASQKAITRARRSVHQTSFLWALVHASVRSTTQRFPAVTGAGLPRLAIWPYRPRAVSHSRGGIIPASEMDGHQFGERSDPG